MFQKVRILLVILLTLLPWPAVWFGMYRAHSLVVTFFLYHGLCLLPGIIMGRNLWRKGFRAPQRGEWILLVAAAIGLALAGYFSYQLTGALIIDKATVLDVLTSRGFKATWLLPLSIYFIIVNATLEELFWRGVILNELKFVDRRWRLFGYGWTAITFAAWHYLVIRLLVRPVWAELVILSLIAMGLFCSWIYEKTGSILLPILWHAFVFDLIVIIVFVALVST